MHVLEWPPYWINIEWFIDWAFKPKYDSLKVLSSHSTRIALSNCCSVVTPASLAWNIVFMTPRTANVACFAGVILLSVTTWKCHICQVVYSVACKVCFPSRVHSLVSIVSALEWINRSGAGCGEITTLLPRSIFVNVFSANAVPSLSTSLYVQLFNTSHAFTCGRESA